MALEIYVCWLSVLYIICTLTDVNSRPLLSVNFSNKGTTLEAKTKLGVELTLSLRKD